MHEFDIERSDERARHHKRWHVDRATAASPAATYACDAAGRITQFNQHAEQLWGRAPRLNDDDARFCGAFRLLDASGVPLEREQSPAAVALRTGVEQQAEVIVERGNGDRVEALACAQPLVVNGQTLSATITLFPLGERRRIATSAPAPDEPLLAIAASVAETVLFADDEGRIVYVSPSMENVLGYRAQELIGRSGFEVAHPDDVVACHSVLNRCRAKHGEQVPFMIRALHRDGSCRWLEGLCTNQFHNPAIGAFVVSFHDATESRRSQDSASLYRSLIDHATDIIEVVEPATGRFLDVNDVACRMQGYTRRELLSMRVADIDPLVAVTSWDGIASTLRTAGTLVFESRHRRKDGTEFPVEVNCTYVRLDRDYFVTVVRDISDRKSAEATYRGLFENVGVGAVEVDRRGKFMRVNDRYCKITGYSRQELLDGMSPVDLSHPDDLEFETQLHRRFFQGEQSTLQREKRYVRKDGSIIWVKVSITLVRDHAGEVRSATGLIEDVSDRIRAEVTLERIIDGIAPKTGQAYFRTLVETLCKVCEVEYAFVSAIDPSDEYRAQTIAACHRGMPIGNVSYDLRGTPCENVVGQSLCYYPTGVQQKFPADRMLVDMGVDAYAGIPLWSHAGQPMGLIVLMNDRPIPEVDRALAVLQVVAARSGAELERARTEESLEKRLVELTFLNQVGLICSHSTTEDDVLRRVTDALVETWHYENCGFLLLDAARGVLVAHPSFVRTDATVSIEDKPLGYGITGTVALTGKLRRTGDVGTDPDYVAAHSRTRSELCLPMTIRNKVVGVLNVESDRAHAFTTADEQLLSTAVELVDNAIERIRAERALRESEERLRMLMENAPFGIQVFNTDGTMVQVNKTWEQQWGMSGTEVVGRYNVHRDAQIDALGLREFVNDVFAGRSVCSRDLEYVPANSRLPGRTRCVRAHGYQIHDSPGGLQHVVLLTEDVTERRRAELERKASEDRLRAVVGNSPNVAIQWYDADGRVKLWNPASQQMFGFSAAEAVGKTLDELIYTPEETKFFVETIADVGRTGKPIGPTEYAFRRRDGRVGTCLSSVFKIPGDDRSDWFVCMDVDVTASKKAERERLELESRVLHGQKLESLGVLAGGIAHDFNNLLTAMLGYAGLASAELPDDSSVRPMLASIEDAARRAADLTRQMLAYAGKGRFVVRPVRLDTLVGGMFALLRSAVSKRATVEQNLQPCTVQGDVAQIHQVVMNLITNASDALGDDDGLITIATGVCEVESAELQSQHLPENLPAGPYAYIEVSDTGCGMRAETLARIFDPFFTTKFTGRGLGLAAVLGIVRSHRGTIKVQTTPGGGTTFRVLLPTTEAAVADPDEQAETKPLPNVEGTILVVEDEPVARQFVCSTLCSVGFRVLTAADGVAGMESYVGRRSEIVAVLLDLTMPRMDGPEFLRRIRELDADVPILVMSGYGEPDGAERVIELGANGFLEKPFHPRQLVDRLRALVPPKKRREVA